MNKEKLLIEDIKKEYLQEKNKKQTTIKSMWSQYQKMGKELSEGIYAEDNHFIYELIQNAEDTKKSKGEKHHILEFTLEDDGLIVFNNEVGFTEDQIKAICSFGQSTKSLDKNEGFIGEKGIGFKSVFKVTDKPAIYSNGYRFHFNKEDSDGTTEYIIPHWINNDELKTYPVAFQNNKFTTLYLPFSKEKKREQINKLKQDITQIEPILLLFLKKLKNIKINQSGRQILNTIKTQSDDEELKCITLKNENSRDDFYVFNKSIDVNLNIDEVKDKNGRRKGVEKREIILAFPNPKNKIKEDRVFSFLPTKLHSELNFIIQADFILQSGRENIAIDSEWNAWQFKEIESFVTNDIIDDLKSHTKIKYDYLRYFLKNGNSHNELIEKLYSNVLESLGKQKSILSSDNTWQKPQNIIITDDVKIDTKYLKLLFGEKYEQVHEDFNLDEFFVNTFKITTVDKKEIVDRICNYFDQGDLNSLDTEVVLELTKFLSKNVKTTNLLETEKRTLQKVKESLPIIPKYSSDKKFYLYEDIYISSEYKPDFIIESLGDKEDFNFQKYNFLSEDYLDVENPNLSNFIRKIISEQKEHKNKKTIEFFAKFPEVLQKYLESNIKQHFKKLLDFLLHNQEDNKDRISKIPLLLTQSSNFYNVDTTVYFANDTDSALETLNDDLLILINKHHDYKELFEQVFGVKNADIVNIILNDYLPWISKEHDSRTPENDLRLIKYTKEIIDNFDKFESEQKQEIRNKLFFISSNQKNKYLKSSRIYLPHNITEIVFNTNSIQYYITDTSFFDLLDYRYDKLIQSNEKKTKEFFQYFLFEKYIKNADISNFIRYVKPDLELDENIEALELINKSISKEDGRKLDEIGSFKVYSQNNSLRKIEDIFYNQVEDLNLDYLHEQYRTIITDLYLKHIKHYFQHPYSIEPFIAYLLKGIKFKEVIKVYDYLDKRSIFDPNKKSEHSQQISADKIRQKFKSNKLIYDRDGKRYDSSDVTWKEEKSANQLLALSTIYPKELEPFFIKKVQISQTKDIKQIIAHIKSIKKKDDAYFDLLVDLNDLVSDNTELDKYIRSYSGKIDSVFDKNVYVNAKQFILKKEKIFILDNNQKNTDKPFYFNDMEIDVPDNLEGKIFSLKTEYTLNYFSNLINTLKITRISSLEKEFSNGVFQKDYKIDNYRKMLDFAYDLLFTKFPDQYKQLDKRRKELENINSVNTISIYNHIIQQITIDNDKLNLDLASDNYYFRDDYLNIVNSKDLFRIIADTIGLISDKDIKDFYAEVIDGYVDQIQYYRRENISKKQHFPLEISSELSRSFNENSSNNRDDDTYIGNDDFLDEDTTIDEIVEDENETAEDKRKKRGADQVGDNENDVSDDQDGNLDPGIATDIEEYQERYKEQKEKLKEAYSDAKRKTKRGAYISKIGDIETKDLFKRRDWYLGQCQSCGFTFKTQKGNYFERFTWTDFTKGKWSKGQKEQINYKCIDAGNSLCLCAKCHSIIKGGGDFQAEFLGSEVKQKLLESDYGFDDFLKDIKSEKLLEAPEAFKEHVDFDDIFSLDIRLNRENNRLYFTEIHLIQFFEFLKS